MYGRVVRAMNVADPSCGQLDYKDQVLTLHTNTYIAAWTTEKNANIAASRDKSQARTEHTSAVAIRLKVTIADVNSL